MRWLIAILVLAASLLPVRASAATVEQIVALSKAGVSEAVILAVIARDRTIFTIEPHQIVSLKREGLSDNVIVAMLKSGREEGDEAARAVSEANAAAILWSLSAGPEVTIVGHGPEEPNVAHSDYGAPYAGTVMAPPLVFYSGVPRNGRGHGPRPRRNVAVQGPALTPVVPPTGMPLPPMPTATGIFFNDNGGPARGIFFPPLPPEPIKR